MRFLRWYRITAVFFSLAAINAAAVDGDQDTSFGSGSSYMALAGAAGAVASSTGPGPVIQSDGKILLCGTVNNGVVTGYDMVAVRFTADGLLDTSFGSGGRAYVNIAGNSNDGCTAIALQSDGKIVLGGATASGADQDFAIARLNTDGSLDTTSFGIGTGKVVVTFNIGGNNNDYGTAIAVQSDGKIVVAGPVDVATGNIDFGVARLNTDGTLDSIGFNAMGGGKQTIGFDLPVMGGALTDFPNAIAIDSQGRIVLVGYATGVGTNTDFAVARLAPDGLLDGTFNGDGRKVVAFDLAGDNNDTALGVTIQRDGKIVVAGAASAAVASDSHDMALVRLDATDGSLDAGFGTGGKVQIPIDLVTDGDDFAAGVVQQSDGKLLIGGSASGSGSPIPVAIAAARLGSNGTPDSSFGFGTGHTAYYLSGFTLQSVGYGVALQNGKIIISGEIETSPTQIDFFATRLVNDLLFTDGFE